MKIRNLAAPIVINIPGGSVTATHVAEFTADKVGFRLRFVEQFFILRDGFPDNGDSGNYTMAHERSIDIADANYEDLIKADGAKLRGNYWITDVRAKAAEIRGG